MYNVLGIVFYTFKKGFESTIIIREIYPKTSSSFDNLTWVESKQSLLNKSNHQTFQVMSIYL